MTPTDRPTLQDRKDLIEELSKTVLRLIDQNRRLRDKVEIALERRCKNCRSEEQLDALVIKFQMGEGWNND